MVHQKKKRIKKYKQQTSGKDVYKESVNTQTNLSMFGGRNTSVPQTIHWMWIHRRPGRTKCGGDGTLAPAAHELKVWTIPPTVDEGMTKI
jgi:hypothetical protein